MNEQLDSLLKIEARLSVLHTALAVFIERSMRRETDIALDHLAKHIAAHVLVPVIAAPAGTEQSQIATHYAGHVGEALRRLLTDIAEARVTYLNDLG
jgi:hypothetical protein